MSLSTRMPHGKIRNLWCEDVSATGESASPAFGIAHEFRSAAAGHYFQKLAINANSVRLGEPICTKRKSSDIRNEFPEEIVRSRRNRSKILLCSSNRSNAMQSSDAVGPNSSISAARFLPNSPRDRSAELSGKATLTDTFAPASLTLSGFTRSDFPLRSVLPTSTSTVAENIEMWSAYGIDQVGALSNRPHPSCQGTNSKHFRIRPWMGQTKKCNALPGP